MTEKIKDLGSNLLKLHSSISDYGEDLKMELATGKIDRKQYLEKMEKLNAVCYKIHESALLLGEI